MRNDSQEDLVTRNYQTETRRIDEHFYVFVDTPGFSDPNLSSQDVLECIADLISLVDGRVTYAGILQVYPTGAAFLNESRRELLGLKQFCGDEFLRSVTVVTTKWDNLAPGAVNQARTDMGTLGRKWSELLPGVRVYHHGLVNGTTLQIERQGEERGRLVRNMISTNYGEADGVCPLFVRELRSGIPVQDTAVGRALRGNEIWEERSTQRIKEGSGTNRQTSWLNSIWNSISSVGWFVRTNTLALLSFVKKLLEKLPKGTRYEPRYGINRFDILIRTPIGHLFTVGLRNGQFVFDSSVDGHFDQDDSDILADLDLDEWELEHQFLDSSEEIGLNLDNLGSSTAFDEVRDAAETVANERESSMWSCRVI